MKLIMKWMWFKETKQLFIGFGFLFGKQYIGFTIGNLFFGLENFENVYEIGKPFIIEKKEKLS